MHWARGGREERATASAHEGVAAGEGREPLRSGFSKEAVR